MNGRLKMSKKILSLVVSIAIAGTVFNGCAKASGEITNNEDKKPTGNQIVLRLAEMHPEDYPTTIGDKQFAKLVEERSNGRIKIIVYAGAELGQEKAVIEQIQFGAIDFARVSVAPVSEFVKELNVIQLPYLYRDEAHYWRVLEGPIGQELLGTVEKAKMIGLAWYDAGARNFYTKKEIKSAADLKGMKIRVPQSKLMMDLVSALGASPTATAAGEVYSALQTGVIDGAENNWPIYVSGRHNEVARYYTIDGHSRIPEIVIASKIIMEKLSKADQHLIKQAARDSVIVQREAWDKKDKESEEKAKATGTKVTEFDQDTLAEFKKAVEPLYNDIGREYKGLIKKIQDTQ
jgi:tripartite ATP-independent transporter DctP family solute receptor